MPPPPKHLDDGDVEEIHILKDKKKRSKLRKIQVEDKTIEEP